MHIRVYCPSCGATGRLPSHTLGSMADCPRCGAAFRLTTGVTEKYRDGHKRAAEELERAMAGPFSSIGICVDSDDRCPECESHRGKKIAVTECTVDMLPPFAECTCDGGCACYFQPVVNESSLLPGVSLNELIAKARRRN